MIPPGDPPNRSPHVQRMMLYCHDGTGIGHLRRGLAICGRLADRFPSASFLLVTGSPYLPLFELPHGVDYVKLPALEKIDNGRYQGKTLCLKTRRLLQCRRALLLATAQYFRPSVFLVDKAPLGVRREVVPTLRWIQRNCPDSRVVFGMRDIEDSPAATREQWLANDVPGMLEEYFDEVWVYGMRSICDVVRDYQLSPRIEQKLTYMGYVARGPCAHDEPAPAESGGSDRFLSPLVAAPTARGCSGRIAPRRPSAWQSTAVNRRSLPGRICRPRRGVNCEMLSAQ